MNVLVIAPHPDDETLGCGGSIHLHAAAGDSVAVAFLTSGEMGLKDLPREQAWQTRETEAKAACAVLGITRIDCLRCPDWYLQDHVQRAAAALRPILQRHAPQLIYLPHPQEWHPDHQAAHPIISDALAGQNQPPELLGYEVWTPMREHHHVRDITRAMAAKLRAARYYASQLRAFRYDRAVRGLNQYRGELSAHCRFAEVFQNLSPLPTPTVP